MLLMPKKTSETINIVGIDPGSVSLGFSVLTYHARTFDIVRTESFTYKAEKLIESDPLLELSHTERFQRIVAQQKNLYSQFSRYNPVVICCESPFYNPRRPSAYGPLVEVMYSIRLAAAQYNPIVRFNTYEPSIVKKSLGISAIADKDTVKKKVVEMKDILSYSGIYPIETLDEHSIDALAVAWCHYKAHLKEG